MERDPCCTIGDYLMLDRVEQSNGSLSSRAVHISSQKMVTVKLLHEDCFTTTDSTLRKIDQFNGCFSTNISILKKLDHNNVVTVLDGLLLNQSIPVSGGGYPFQLRAMVVMEYCYGSDLKHWLCGLQNLGNSSQLKIFSQIVDGINYLHNQNIVHGRIQPVNVWVQGGRPMLCGFGLGNCCDGNEIEFMDYVAPECVVYLMDYFPHLPGKKSDVFSLGILLVQLHTGQHAFHEWKRSTLNAAYSYRWNLKDLRTGDTFTHLPAWHCLTNFMKKLLYLMISPVYTLRIDVQIVKDMLDNEMV